MADIPDSVAARARVAEDVLSNPELLKLYLGLGGLEPDLKDVILAGRRAEALSLGRSHASADGGTAHDGALEKFVDLQHTYVTIMAVLRAVRRDMEKAKAPHKLLASIDSLLAKEATVFIAGASRSDGKKKAKKPKAREDLRGEISSQAKDLLQLPGIHGALAERRIDIVRLKQFRKDAKSLEGKLGSEATSKNPSNKAVTRAIRKAIAEQTRNWGACFRLLGLLGDRDGRVRHLLKETKE